jgi:hypothetical protein
MGLIYMKVKEVSRRAEKWSMGTMGASIVSNVQSSETNINDGALHTRIQISEGVPRRVSITGNENRSRSRYAKRTQEAAWQAFLYVIAYAVTHMWAFVVVNIELGGGTTPSFLILIENFFWPLQGFANVFIFLRPRIQSIQKSSPEMFYFTAAYHSVFHYDEVTGHQNGLQPSDNVGQPEGGATHSTAESLQKKLWGVTTLVHLNPPENETTGGKQRHQYASKPWNE